MASDDDPARPVAHGDGVPRSAVYQDAAARSPRAVPGLEPGRDYGHSSGRGLGPTEVTTQSTTRDKDGRSWQIGTDADVEWISRRTVVGLTVASAIPRVFEAYATVVVPELRAGLDEHEQRVVRLLADDSIDHDWWLGYLDTGASDIIFPDAPRVRMYSGWSYVLVKAGPEQALRWRAEPSPLHCGLPDLMFPTDRSWLISALWDDEWWCLGGSESLVTTFLREPGVRSRRVGPCDDATPPGHVAR